MDGVAPFLVEPLLNRVGIALSFIMISPLSSTAMFVIDICHNLVVITNVSVNKFLVLIQFYQFYL